METASSQYDATSAVSHYQSETSLMQEDDCSIDTGVINAMIEACTAGNSELVESIVTSHGTLYACQQVDATGTSPLMAAAAVGHYSVCQYLLQNGGAPWNAVDRNGQCAGNYAMQGEHWDVVNLLVEWGTRAELILGAVERERRGRNGDGLSATTTTTSTMIAGRTAAAASSVHDDTDIVAPREEMAIVPPVPVEYEPCTKPDYLRQPLRYTADGQTLLDADNDAVMMAWERPLMKAHADILMGPSSSSLVSSSSLSHNEAAIAMPRTKRVLNVGFGLGIIDTALQELQPTHHIIIEAHPDVYKRMLETDWDKKPTVRICFGTWQEILPQLIAEGVVVDAIFYDTYGEHFMDLEDFHSLMVKILAKPGGIYSFFNGLAPDNLFFHGVACQCVKLQLASLGLDSEFLTCEISAIDDAVWAGVRRKYWHGRDTYYLPVCTWNAHFLQTGQPTVTDAFVQVSASLKRKAVEATDEDDMEMDASGDTTKRLQTTF